MGTGTGGYVLNSITIILIDILLSGDNSVAIAMAVHALPRGKRFQGILIGASGVVVIRTLLTWFASNLVQTPFLKLVGGLLILWIAIKLLIEEAETGPDGGKKASTLWHAVWLILVADITMSPDNVLAVAGAAKGSMSILWISLGLSIPVVILSCSVLSGLMNRFPFVVVLGAALLGKVGGEMIFTDPAIIGWFHLEESMVLRYAFEALCAGIVLVTAYRLRRRAGAAGFPTAEPAVEPPVKPATEAAAVARSADPPTAP